MLVIFERYPALKEKLAHIALGEFPTPVEKFEQFGRSIQAPQLYVKRDDLSGRLYGGNKVRALEFLFGAALQAGHQDVFALGFPASCQALAQAIYAREVGLRSTAFLFPQTRSEQARRHLLTYQSINADLRPTIPMILPFLIGHRLKHGRFPKLLEASTPVGMLGYVSAGFELGKQIEERLIPEPDLVYLSIGTMGTATGLMLGIKAAGLKSKIVAVEAGGKILGRKVISFARVSKLFHETNDLLRANDPSFPALEVTAREINLRPGFERGETTLLTAAGSQAMERAKELAGLQLDEMFTANAFAALLADSEAGQLQGKTVLWWNSYSSRDLSAQTAAADFRRLPKTFQRYFTAP